MPYDMNPNILKSFWLASLSKSISATNSVGPVTCSMHWMSTETASVLMPFPRHSGSRCIPISEGVSPVARPQILTAIVLSSVLLAQATQEGINVVEKVALFRLAKHEPLGLREHSVSVEEV